MIDDKKVEMIKDALKKNSKGLTIDEVAEWCRMNRMTASKYLYYLLGRGDVEARKVGVAILFYIKK